MTLVAYLLNVFHLEFLKVEMNPVWQQKKLNEFCKKNEILLTAYSPLGASGTKWGHNRVMECDVLQNIAKSREKTVAQVLYLFSFS